jgi:type IV pilus assembly protein PilB
MQLNSPLIRKLINFGYLNSNAITSIDKNQSIVEQICKISDFSATELAQKAAQLFQIPHLSIKNINLALLPEGSIRNEKLIRKHRVLPIALKGKKTLSGHSRSH